MPKKKAETIAVTSYGTDGAASGAMVLRMDPSARIVVTSTSRLAGALLGLASSCNKNSKVEICGLGVGDIPHDTLAALSKLTAKGAAVTWYCGRGYLDDYAKQIGTICTAVMKTCDSNTEAIFRHNKQRKDKLATLLLDLAAEYAEKSDPANDDHAWWHDFVQASAARYFHFGDGSAYPDCIRKLAGLEAVWQGDTGMVNRWRKLSGKMFPVGNSKAMKRLRKMISRVGPIEEPVLVLGPSGCGKELVARLIHEASPRAGKPFVPVNCAILSTSSDLAHDRLFGHKAGAYTGADKDGKGAFEAADDGTLFLDEVGELPLEAQTQLLRVLEEGAVLPLGTMEPKTVNVRVVCATNRDLAKMVEDGTFRLDLYHRLNVLALRVPPLRERREDMKSIANGVMHQLKENGHTLKISQADWQAIADCGWPGNIRQFINILKRAAYMQIPVADVLAEESRQIYPSANAGLDDIFRPATPESISPEDNVRRIYMQHCFDLCDGNWTQTAQKLGLSVNTLRKWLDA